MKTRRKSLFGFLAALCLAALCPAALCLTAGVTRAQEAEPAKADGLPAEELESRREALKSRLFEPAVLEASSFRLAFERGTSSFILEDLRGDSPWHSSLVRKGFATVLLREGGRALPVDQVEDLRVDGKEIRFRAKSSRGEIPEVRFSLRVLEPLVGLEIRCEASAEAAAKLRGVRLLDDSPWVADADGGGVVAPYGLGEWIAATDGPDLRRRFRRADGPWSEVAGPIERATMASCCLVRGSGTLLVDWDSPGAELELRRTAVEAPGFPGTRGVVMSVEVSSATGPPSGSISGAVRFYPLGKGDQIEGAHSLRQLVIRRDDVQSLRRKTESREELRAFLGAAILRARLSGPEGSADRRATFAEVAAIGDRWRQALGIDQALVLLDGWNARAAGDASAGPLLPASARAGGDQGLSDCARRLHEHGWLLGLTASGIDGLAGALPALKSVPADVILVPSEGPAHSREGLAALAAAIDAAGAIAATDGAGEAWPARFGLLMGLLSHKALHPFDRPIFPLFAFSYGQAARLTVRPEDALEPDQPERLLAHLALGEVPLYALPAAGDGEEPAGDPRWCLSRSDGGWAEGKGLTARERFVKNSYEVLSHVARIRSRTTLLFHRYLTPDRTVEEAYFGPDLRIVVNYGEREYADEDAGFKLPRFGFWVQHPMFHAFYASRAHEVDYSPPAFFTVRSLEGKMYLRAESVRIYHGFGSPLIRLGGRDFLVSRESNVRIW